MSTQDSTVTQQQMQLRIRRAERRRHLMRQSVPYLLLLPAGIMLVIFLIYPMINTIILSFWRYPLLNPDQQAFVGFENFARLFRSDTFWASLDFTLRFTFVAIVLEFIIGIGGALLLDQVKLWRPLFTSIVILPYMVAPVAAGLIWRLIWSHDFGLANFALTTVGVDRVVWLGEPQPAFWSVVISEVWRTTPFVMLILLAGLTSIPHELIESARIDGASPRQVFTRIILPLLAPAITVSLVFQTIFKLRVFDLVFTLTGGGPGRATTPIGLMIQRTYFRFFEGGEASAIAVILLILGAVVSLIYLKLIYREVEY